MAYGTVNADVIQTSTSGGILGAGNASIMKNRIINGAMVIDQRNAGASVTIPAATNTYTLDRWIGYGTLASKFTVQQNAASVTPPAGFTNYLGATSSAATTVGTSDEYELIQKIEGFNVADLGWGTANAKTITVSAWVRSSLTGTFGGVLTNSALNRIYPFTYSIPVANTWTAISVTIAGDTSGTWLTTNGTGIYVSFCLGAGATVSGTAGAWGSTYYASATGATSVVGTNGATFYITGVQLEVGSSATGFEYVNYQTSLANCQRYYWRTAGGSGVQFAAIGSGYANTTSGATVVIPIPVTMRSIPTLNFGGTINVLPASATTAVTSIAQSYTGNGCVWVVFGLSVASLTIGTGAIVYTQNASTNFLDASAEL
jgi:hypothetical protein